MAASARPPRSRSRRSSSPAGSTGSRSPATRRTSQRSPRSGAASATRLATGERCYTKHHLQALLRDCEVGVLQPDVIHVGGILEAKKIAAIADAQLHAGLLPQPVRAGRDRGGDPARRLHHQLHHAGIVLRVQRALALRPVRAPAAARWRPLRDPDAARASASASSAPRSPARTPSTRTPSCRCGARTGASAFEPRSLHWNHIQARRY